MARYAIGDIQGCMSSLERLLVAIEFDRTRDQLWLTGDLVNRGPRSLDVLRWARAQGDAVHTVLGNHDLHLLARVTGTAPAKRRDTLDEILAAPDRDALIDWLRARPLVHHDDRFVLVHAGLHPRWSVERARAIASELEAELRGAGWQKFIAATAGGAPAPRWDDRLAGADRWRAALAYFVRVRMCHRDGSLEPEFDGPPRDAPPECVAWFALPDPAWATHTAIFGHWAALGLELGANHLGLDTGCVWGKALTALRLDDRAVTQVKAVETTR